MGAGGGDVMPPAAPPHWPAVGAGSSGSGVRGEGRGSGPGIGTSAGRHGPARPGFYPATAAILYYTVLSYSLRVPGKGAGAVINGLKISLLL